MRRVALLLTSCCLLVQCSASDEGAPGSSTPPGPPAFPATGISIGEVSINQGVKVLLRAADGSDVESLNAPIVAGRGALLRVFFAPHDGWNPHPVRLLVTLQNGAGTQVLKAEGTPGGPSTDANLQSSAFFTLDGAQLDGALSIKVEMFDVEQQDSTDTSGTVWPEGGLRALGEQSTNGNFQLRLVPIVYDGDGSGRTPTIDDALVEQVRNAFLGQYPIPGIDIEVGDPFTWSGKLSANGQGWQSMMMSFMSLRAKDERANVYYYGLVLPGTSFNSFCGFGCVAGLTLLNGNTGDRGQRSSVGLAFDMPETLNTILHETGHANRRLHAPCSPDPSVLQQIDPAFPYKQGQIGVWGYDLIEKKLKDPDQSHDFMGYCSNNWVSDYTFSALFDRILELNTQAAPYVFPAPVRYRQAWLDVEGELRWGEIVERTVPPGGDPLEVTLGRGPHARRVTGSFYPMSHLPGGLLLLPEDVATTATLDAGREGSFRVK